VKSLMICCVVLSVECEISRRSVHYPEDDFLPRRTKRDPGGSDG
jgi:hypothetical protein